MAENETPKDWASDVKKYAPGADDAVIAGIVRHCGIALRSRDAALVSFTDPEELTTVRESFCKKKLGLTDPDDVLDAAIAQVGQRMSDTTLRNRVTVYYLLAEAFGKLALFGGAAGAAVPVAAAAAAPVAEPVRPVPLAAPIPAGARPRPGGGDGDFFGTAALVFGAGATLMLVAAIVAMYISSRSEDAVAAPPAPPAPVETVAAAPAIPEGAGTIFELIDGRPKESVYFEVSKSELAPEFAEVSAPFKAWMDANPNDRITVSGFNDPSGNAEANAALAKARAEAVAQGLVSLGVPADRIDLVKPAETSDATVTPAEARRVEITVTGS